jgi:hypothetical protein
VSFCEAHRAVRHAFLTWLRLHTPQDEGPVDAIGTRQSLYEHCTVFLRHAAVSAEVSVRAALPAHGCPHCGTWLLRQAQLRAGLNNTTPPKLNTIK